MSKVAAHTRKSLLDRHAKTTWQTHITTWITTPSTGLRFWPYGIFSSFHNLSLTISCICISPWNTLCTFHYGWFSSIQVPIHTVTRSRKRPRSMHKTLLAARTNSLPRSDRCRRLQKPVTSVILHRSFFFGCLITSPGTTSYHCLAAPHSVD